jgi:GWxTD domain-containing protein
MTSMMSWIHIPGAATLGQTLLHSLWEGAAVALGLAVVLSIARSARTRYAAACVAMGVLLIGLTITFVRLMPDEPTHVAISGSHFGALLAIDPNSGTVLSRVESSSLDNLSWLAPFWLAGVLIFYLRGFVGWMAARRLQQTGVCQAADFWQDRMTQLRMRLGVKRQVALLESCLAEVPVVIGYLRPIILMPVGLMTGMPTAQVESVLMHELAHIRRYDYLVNLLQVFVEGLLFYHPAVWWISGVMRSERENCCDDLVVGVTGSVLEYAAALTTLEEKRETSAMALAATGGGLVKRIQRLLGYSDRRYSAVMPVFAAAVLTMIAVTAVAGLQQVRTAAVPQKTAAESASKSALPADQIETGMPELTMPHPLPASYKPDPVVFQHVYSAYSKIAKPALLAQAAAPQPQSPEQQKAEEKALKKELLTPYKKWLDEDVTYIISEEERKAFRQLNTDEERGQFVEQFWLRRDPTPGTNENEFKAEIYRRIDYANVHFAEKVAGWRTDRGRIYIVYGPPDEKEIHPAGDNGSYPFEQWRYRFIEGVGNNVIIEFVDKTSSGEYKMTMYPAAQQDILRLQPGGLRQ